MVIEVNIRGSTKPGFELPLKEALRFSAQFAGICYLQDSFEAILEEPEKITRARISRTLNSGHHSVYGHPTFNFEIVGMPKALVMFLNNEKVHVTSEKSARYTQMEPSPEEKILYDRWLPIFEQQILARYPRIGDDKAVKLAQENARYLTSVFTPTTMGHTLNLRQLNYLTHWFQDFVESAPDTPFNERLKPSMLEFNQAVSHLYVKKLDPEARLRHLSLLGTRERQEEFGEHYSVNYEGTFAQLAQAQRHRTLYYEITTIDYPTRFFVPPIIADNPELTEQWLQDIKSVAQHYPQGTLLPINERGNYENFISKLGERLCGHAQLEIALRTKATLERYVEETEQSHPVIHKELLAYNNGPRCTFDDYQCTSACHFGKKGLQRLI